MQLKIIASFALALSLQQSKAQTANIAKEQWSDGARIHQIKAAYNGEPAVVLLNKKRIEYIDESKNEVGEYVTLHKIIHVNDDRGIETFNKIYLGVTGSIDIVDMKARTILPGGKTIELDKKDIKDFKESDGNSYKIFALEGLEKGCEVEYYYTYKIPASYFGTQTAQSSIPILESQLEIICPQRLEFEIKPYLCQVNAKDTIVDTQRRIYASVSEAPGLEEEKYASYNVNLRRLEYKLSYNNAIRKGERLFTWNELAKRMFNRYTSFSGKETKKVSQMVKDNDWGMLSGEENKIMAVENLVKKNFATREDIDGADAENLEWIIKNKIASSPGIVRLYCALFQELGVNYQVVLSSDRNENFIDKDFENWNNTDSPIFYFPDEKKCLSPTRADFRYPWIFPSWGATNGLFCKGTTIGNFATAIAEVKPVPLEDYTKSYSNVEDRIEFNKECDSLIVDMKQIFGGYNAAYYRGSYNFSSAEEQKQMLKEMVKFGTNSEQIISSEIQNAAFEEANSNKPFIVQAKVKAGELVERAGNKILLKIGEIIGPQAELYQEKPRQLPIKIEFPHFLERKIELIIPDGFKIRNPDDLKMEQVFREDGELTMGFVSSYQLVGNRLSIKIMEEYRKTYYPLSQYEDFKRIINASADFNKIVLVMEKQ